MLAAQVNARKHDKLRMILGFDWSWGLGFCEALLGWVVIAAAVAGRAFGLIWTEDPSPTFACWRELWVPIALCSDRSFVGCSAQSRRSRACRTCGVLGLLGHQSSEGRATRSQEHERRPPQLLPCLLLLAVQHATEQYLVDKRIAPS